nr:mucoidy inhibitor MuiA family protein [uncultured Carboxylicivirga sp.]
MRTLHILLFSLFVTQIFGQKINEKIVNSQVNEVTVFLKNAQVTRKKSVEISSGTTLVKFTNLSPFIDAKSIQVKANGELTVLSVNHQQNYLDQSQKPDELVKLENQLESIIEKINIENTYLNIIKEELAFLNENKDVGARNHEVSIDYLQKASEFYGAKLTALKLKEIERNKTLSKLQEQQNNISRQINTLTNKKEFPTGEILVKVKSSAARSYQLELSYVVANAGWFPSYDIRAKNINEPVQLVYKANVKQDTKVDWNNAKLKFSSANPNTSGVAPSLIPYFLDYYSTPPTYKNLMLNQVSGTIMDTNGEPLLGVTVNVEGTTIGTVSDMSGKYTLTVPDNNSRLAFSFIGFSNQIRSINGPVMNIHLQEETTSLDEVIVVGYGSSSSKALTGAVAGVKKENIKISGRSSLAVPTARIENQTTVDFEIKTPYTIKSDNKNYVVEMEYLNLPAFYQYYSVPKIDKDAFLIAKIVDWEKYNLLEGEANLFFEDTYVGKTILDVRYASDTLDISLGRDKQVSVNREKVKDFTSKKFIGSKKEETRAYKTIIRNNKNQPVNMIILDQVPVSTLEEIEVTVSNSSWAKQNIITGEMKWQFTLDPLKSKELQLKYSVKYPKNRNLVIE